MYREKDESACPRVMANCKDGLSASMWIKVQASRLPSTKDKFLLWYEGSFQMYISQGEVLIEVGDADLPNCTAVSFPIKPATLFPHPLRIVTDRWTNLAFAYKGTAIKNAKGLSTLERIDVYLNGQRMPVNKVVGKYCTIDNGKPGDVIVGWPSASQLETVSNMMVHDLAIWKRYLYPEEVHRFLGLAGISFNYSISFLFKTLTFI